MRLIALLFLGLALPLGAMAVEQPGPKPHYKGRIQINNWARRPASDLVQVREYAQGACLRMHRALYASTHLWPQIWKNVSSTKSINMSVLYRNRAFYQKRWKKRLSACQSGRIKLRTAGTRGYCRSDNGTEAYVKVTFGFVHSTINLCDLYFRGGNKSSRIETMAHEFGRLEDIGDSPDFDTNNIYVWDAITRWLSQDRNWKRLVAP